MRALLFNPYRILRRHRHHRTYPDTLGPCPVSHWRFLRKDHRELPNNQPHPNRCRHQNRHYTCCTSFNWLGSIQFIINPFDDATIRETEISIFIHRYYQVFMDHNTHKITGLDNSFCYGHVLWGWIRVFTWMVMTQNQRG